MGSHKDNREIIAAFLFVAGFLAALAVPSQADARTVRVVTRENAVREQCRFFAPVKAKVSYGDALEVLSEEGDWFMVKFEEQEGCIHKSAVTEKKLKRKKKKTGTAKAGTATEEEVALAGKGFNPQVEKRYREEHPDAEFATVDYIEGIDVPEEALLEFIESGGLKQP